MTSYIGRVVMVIATGEKGEVIEEEWENGPILKIKVSSVKSIWLPDYEISVL